ncbi:MAG: hypothetical protein ACI9PP_001046 [Halobacteriales archaeon]|jgi:hypothetical protein
MNEDEATETGGSETVEGPPDPRPIEAAVPDEFGLVQVCPIDAGQGARKGTEF